MNTVNVKAIIKYMESNKTQTPYITTLIYLRGRNKLSDLNQIMEIQLKPEKPLTVSQFQLLVIKNDLRSKIKSNGVLIYDEIEAQLFKGISRTGEYYLVKVKFDEYVTTSSFLTKPEIELVNSYLELGASFLDQTQNAS